MQKIFLFAVGLIMVGALFSAALPASAQNNQSQLCPSDGSDLTRIDTVCNPSKFYLDFGHDENTFPGLITFIIRQLLLIIGLLSMLFIVIGGFRYVTSGGNEELAESGKKTLTNAIIGLVIVILSYIIVVVVIKALQGDI